LNTILIESTPARLGRINRDAGVITGATMIGATSSNGVGGRRYSVAALKKIASMSEGLPGFLNHVAPSEAFKPRPVQDIAVRWHNVRFDPTNHRVVGDMHVLPHHKELVFGLAEQFGDRIGNSLVSKGSVRQEANGEVVDDILAVRSADIVSDPASTKGLFEGKSDSSSLTILDLIEALKGVQPMTDDEKIGRVLAAINGTSYAAPGKSPQVIQESKELPGSTIQRVLDACNK